MFRFTRSRGMDADTSKEQDEVVPPRPRMIVWVMQLVPESIGTVASTGASTPSAA